MDEKELQFFDTLIQVKLNIADIYEIFSKAVPLDSPFWAELAWEKTNHASLLKSGRNALLSSAGFPLKGFPHDIQPLLDTKDRFFSLLAEFSMAAPDRAKAFETALMIEKSSTERYSQYLLRSILQSDNMALFEYPLEKPANTLKRLCDYLQSMKKLHQLPSIVGESILIVKDETGVTGLLKAIMTEFLSAKEHFDAVGTGQEAMDKITEKYYKLIISDVDMPLMDGIEFFTQASKLFPNMNKRFLFVTGDLSPERQEFFQEHNLEFITHPASVTEIQEKSQRVLLS